MSGASREGKRRKVYPYDLGGGDAVLLPVGPINAPNGALPALTHRPTSGRLSSGAIRPLRLCDPPLHTEPDDDRSCLYAPRRSRRPAGKREISLWSWRAACLSASTASTRLHSYRTVLADRALEQARCAEKRSHEASTGASCTASPSRSKTLSTRRHPDLLRLYAHAGLAARL